MALVLRKSKKLETVNKVSNRTTIKRYVHYYELLTGYRKGHEENPKSSFMNLLAAVIEENKNKGSSRFFVYDGKTFCVQGLTVKDEDKIAYGKLCAIRSEDFPQVFNMRNDSTRDFDAEDFEGIVEFSHFVINYKPHYERIAMEYNQYGGKILDLTRYFAHIGSVHGITTGMIPKNVINENLDKMKDKIGRISRITAKVNRSNIESIRKMESGLGSVFASAEEHFVLQDIEVILKFDYSHMATENPIYKAINSIINKFTRNPQQTELFLKLNVDAENKERDNQIQAFDLLVDKVRSEVRVAKDGKSRTVVTNEMLQTMIVEMKKLNL